MTLSNTIKNKVLKGFSLHLPFALKGIAFATICVLGGCASVTVHKLDSAGKIDPTSPEGIPFFLPRPYISVYEPFIVASDVYLANGEISPDGNYVLLTQVPQGLDSIISKQLQNGATQKGGTWKIDASRVFAVGAGAPNGAPVDGDTASQTVTPVTANQPDSNESSNAGTTPNKSSFKVSNDNLAFAITPQPRYFNILWLPDPEEKYVVQVKQGLGTADITLNLGQGWSLQGLSGTVDNSKIVNPFLDIYSASLTALQKVMTAKIQAPLAMLAGGSPNGAPVGGTPNAKIFEGGTPVTVKVTKVRIAAPGLYKILKPTETGVSLSAEENKRILAPKQPFTNIAFNTYDAIILEASRATGDSALRIHQYVESVNSTQSAYQDASTEQSKPSESNALGPIQKALNIFLSNPARITQDGQYYKATLTNNSNGEVIVKLTKVSKGKPGKAEKLPALDDSLKNEIIATIKQNAKALTVKPENIKMANL